MDRSLYYSGQENLRTFDLNNNFRDILKALCRAQGDAYFGGASSTTPTIVAGFSATATSPVSLSFNLAEGEIWEYTETDTNAIASIGADTSNILQQGYAPAQTVTLTTSALLSGQSQWVLVEVSFLQQDIVRASDPTGGILPYYDTANPDVPLQGPGGTSQVQDSERNGLAKVQVVYGTPATTGSEVPPGVDAGYVPLYLIDLNYGQSAVLQNQIKVAGTAAYPPGYTQAPFLAGLLNSHHSGVLGQAPKIQLTAAAEIQGTIPITNTPATSTNSTGLLATIYQGSGAPTVTTLAAGNYDTRDLYLDYLNSILYVCTFAGTASTSVWNRAVPTQLFAQPPFTNAQLTGPLLSGVTPGTGIAVAPTSVSGIETQQVSCNNVPNSVLQGPLVSQLIAGSNIIINGAQGSGASSLTINAILGDLGHQFTQNGYVKIPGGLVAQWGVFNSTNVSTGGSIFTNFNITFPSTCFFVIWTVDQGVPGTWITLQLANVNANMASWTVNLGLSNQTFATRWIALGF